MKAYVLLLHWQYGSLVRGVFTSLKATWERAQLIEDTTNEGEEVNFSPSPIMVDENGIPDRFVAAYGYQRVDGARRLWQAEMRTHLWTIEERPLEEQEQ